ncbi:MAG: DUF2341 domain-containing protein [Myxococcota bacterium]
MSREARGPRWALFACVAGISCEAPTFVVEDPSTTTAGDSTVGGTTSPVSTDTSGGTDASSSGEGGCAADGTGEIPEDWWNPAWIRRRLITIDPSIVPEGGLVDGFPVLVRVDGLPPQPPCSPEGGDELRFRTVDDDAQLLHDVDEWSPDGMLMVWLRVPALVSGGEPLRVWMYYGNPEAEPVDASANLWTDYISVHHLGADLEDSVGEHPGDAQWPPKLCADPSDSDSAVCTPKSGCARSFDPDMLHDVVLPSPSRYDFGDGPGGVSGDQPNLTVSLWFDASSTAMDTPLVAKGDTAWKIEFTEESEVAFVVDCRQPQEGCDPSDDDFSVVAADTPVSQGWHHVAVTSAPAGDGLDLAIYVDGELRGESHLMDYVGQNGQPLRFGHNLEAATRYAGALDEIRVIDKRRSDEWIAAEYRTVTESHVTVGEEQLLCP